MSNLRIKITLYVVFGVAALFFGWRTYRAVQGGERPPVTQFSVGLTNDAGSSTNASATTNSDATAGTNEARAANGTNVAATAVEAPDDDAAPRRRKFSGIIVNGLLCTLSLVGLGLLMGRDVSKTLGGKAVDAMGYDLDWDPQGPDPDYEHAEQVLHDGRPLEAVELMRDYLKKHPREQYVAITIAEIYEKQLRNPLAAALEYEAILSHPIYPEKWCRLALRLCNLYSGPLNQSDKAVALLRRIVKEHPETKSADKARERLGMVSDPSVATTGGEGELPPGFRAKR